MLEYALTLRQFEKIVYKPIPVRKLLLEMKNLSELMIDLAYSRCPIQR